MPGIILFTLVVAIVVIVLLYVHDARRAHEQRDGRPVVRQAPAPAPRESGDTLGATDLEALADHVRELRRAVDNGLIGREEAIASVIRQAEGRISERAAEQLLDSAELD